MLITDAYRAEQAALHAKGNYGTAALQFGATVSALLSSTGAQSLLDYGCGSKRSLLQALRLPENVVYEGYDPAIPAYAVAPCPSELVTCIDVLEHIEPTLLDNVLDHLAELTDPYGFFTIHTGPALKVLSDGRNAHLTQEGPEWWLPRLQRRFKVLATHEIPSGFAVVVRSLHSDISLPLPSPLRFPPLTPQRERKDKLSATHTTIVESLGARLVFHTPNDVTVEQVNTLPTKEQDTIQWIAGMTSENVFLDVGANVGLFSVLAASTRKAKVFSFEPEAQNFAVLNANLGANKLENQVLAYPLVLSDKMQMGKLQVSKASAGAADHCFQDLTRIDSEHRFSFTQGAFSTTIDQLISSGSMPTPNYLRIDAQGLEHRVLAGAMNALQNPALREILMRLNTQLPEHQHLIQQLSQLGFLVDSRPHNASIESPGKPGSLTQFIFKRSLRVAKGVAFAKTFTLTPAPTACGRAVMDHLFRRVAETQVCHDPFPYAVVDQVFPQDYYQEMLANFPTEESLRPIGETGRVPQNAYKERHVVLFTDDEFSRMTPAQQKFWQEFAGWMYSDLFLSLFVSKFQSVLGPRLEKILATDTALKARSDALLVNDHTRYAIGPHTDAAHRLVTFLFYLPPDDSMRELGTSVFRPKDPNFICWGGPHYGFDRFDKVSTVEFLPNRLLTFPKTERSFHGVEEITRENINRPLLINNIRLLNSVTH